MTTISLNKFADKLNEIIPVMMKELSQRQTNELYKGKISLPQFVVISFLDKNGLSNMTELAHAMKITLAGTTGIVARLVKSGYVRRVPDPRDRRIIKIKLMPKGERVLKKVSEERRYMIIDIFGRISEGERRQYLKILTHIRDILVEKDKGCAC